MRLRSWIEEERGGRSEEGLAMGEGLKVKIKTRS